MTQVAEKQLVAPSGRPLSARERNGMTYSDRPDQGLVLQNLTAAMNNLAKGLSATVDTSMASQETPSGYLDQVDRARELWSPYGSNSGKYSDAICCAVMDLMVAAATVYGTENMLKGDVAVDHPARKVLNHFCATVNSGNPTLTQGLDYFRVQWHKGRWGDGGCVPSWAEPTLIEAPDGIPDYKAPKKMAILQRTQFDMGSSDEFGGFKLKWRDDISSNRSADTDEVESDEKTGEIKDFLTAGRYQVCDRGRMEASAKFPVPYLVQRGLTRIAARERAAQRGDYQTILRVIRSILLITQGAKEWIESEVIDWSPFDTISDLAGLKTELKTDDGKFNNVITAPYSTSAEWITPPDMKELLSPGKFEHDDMLRLAGLGLMKITDRAGRTQNEYDAKGLILEVLDAMRADRRFIENRIFPLLWEANPEIFKGLEPANFWQKPPSIFLGAAAHEALLKLYEMGLAGKGTTFESILGLGADIDGEAGRIRSEKASGYDEIFVPNPSFAQTVVTEGKPKPADTNDDDNDDDDGEAATLKASVTQDKFDGLEKVVVSIAATDDSNARKRRSIAAVILGAMAMWGSELRTKLQAHYAGLFDGTATHTTELGVYYENMEDGLSDFGDDLLDPGLYEALESDDVADAIAEVFASKRHRIGLYDTEPFRVVTIAAGAAKAIDAGMIYAVRHSAFLPTTCEFCISRHGEVVFISELFAGTFDHPHGACTYSYHTTEADADNVVSAMLTIEEINAVHTRIAADLESIVGEK